MARHLDQLTRAGTPWGKCPDTQAEAVLRYRDRAGGLRDEAGLRACYLIADSVADLLLPFVIFPEREPHRQRGPVEINGADSAALRSVAVSISFSSSR